MEIGTALFIVAILVIAIWVFLQVKRMKHKMFAIVLIALILFFYLSATFVFKDKEINLKTLDGIKNAAGIYFSWLGSAFQNVKTITTNAVDMDWEGNKSAE